MVTPLTVPPDQLHLPRRDRQFPYRPADDRERAEVRAELDQVIRGIERMIYKTLNDSAAWASPEQREDWSQEIALHLAFSAMPRFDQWREPKTKISTFIQVCIRQYLWHLMRKRRRSFTRRPEPLWLESSSPERFIAADQSPDREIEAIADVVLANPSMLGSGIASEVIHEARETSDQAVADRLKIKKQHVLSARCRMRHRVPRLLDTAIAA